MLPYAARRAAGRPAVATEAVPTAVMLRSRAG